MSGQDCFEIRDSALLSSIGGTVTTAKHLRTGADLVHVSCAEDPENYFGICFRTMPEDDTGVLHMLEHMVLEGSDKYPIRHGFKEIHKRSISTMLSAFTGGDRTVYHCGSLYQDDYLNLVSYLMDAVFHPLLKRDAFLQEGYRLDLATPGDTSSELIHTGVVYNEMKGVEGWPDGQMAREIDRRLYPRGAYGFCAAGCSASIPGSTLDRILAAHRRFYQPVNSCLFLFTAQPFGRMADFLDGRLPSNDPDSLRFSPLIQSGFDSPVHFEHPINGSVHDKCSATLSWVVDNHADPVETLTYTLLGNALCESETSPLRKALLDQGRFQGFFPWSFFPEPLQQSFTIGLKGIEKEFCNSAHRLVIEQLTDLAETGLNEQLVNTILSKLELQQRERGAEWPFSIMCSCMRAWVHDESVLDNLNLDLQFDSLRRRLEQDPRLLQKLIRTQFLDNTHRVEGVFIVDCGNLSLQQEEDLAGLKRSMTGNSLDELAKESLRLHSEMGKASSPDELGCLPSVNLSSLPVTPFTPFHRTFSSRNGSILHSLRTDSELCFIDLRFNVSSLPLSCMSLLALFSQVSFSGSSYGIEVSPVVTGPLPEGNESYVLHLGVRGRCRTSSLSDMLGRIGDTLTSGTAVDPKTLLTAAVELGERKVGEIIPQGDLHASLMARSSITEACCIRNHVLGIPAIKRLAAASRGDPAELHDSFLKIRNHLQASAPDVLAVTGTEEALHKADDWLRKLARQTPGKHRNTAIPFDDAPLLAGMEITGQSGFAASSFRGLSLEHPLEPAVQVFLSLLTDGCLCDEIRVKGAAYNLSLEMNGSAVTFSTYRDPYPDRSLAVFREALTAERAKAHIQRENCRFAVMSVLKRINRFHRSATANGIAIHRHITGQNKESFQRYVTALLGIDTVSVLKGAERLSAEAEHMHQFVIAGKAILDRMRMEKRTSILP